jgi:hypothetical protein
MISRPFATINAEISLADDYRVFRLTSRGIAQAPERDAQVRMALREALTRLSNFAVEQAAGSHPLAAAAHRGR